MNRRTKWFLTVIAVLAFSLVAFTGAAFAQIDTPNDDTTNPLAEMQQWMEEHMGEGSWAAMIQRMTQVHGAEFTGEMLQYMAEGETCHGTDVGFGQGMMGGRFNYSSTLGEGFNGHGMMGGRFNR